LSKTEDDTFKHHVEISSAELTWNFFEDIELLEPFGPMNPEVRIKIPSASIMNVNPMSDGKHALFKIKGAPQYLECILWKRGEEITKIFEEKRSVGLIGCLEKSNFRGRTTLRFRIEALI